MADGPFSFYSANLDGVAFGIAASTIFSALGGVVKKAGARAIAYGLCAGAAIQTILMPVSYKLFGWGWEHWAVAGAVVGLTSSLIILTVVAVAEGVFKRNPDIAAQILKRAGVETSSVKGEG
jgi:exosortase/archaeosortase